VTSLLKQRLIGAIVLISLGIIFIPMLLTGKGNIFDDDLKSNVPPKPMYEIKAPAVLPLEKQEVTENSLQPVKDNDESPDTRAEETASTESATKTISEEAAPAVTAPAEKADSSTATVASSSVPPATKPDTGKVAKSVEEIPTTPPKTSVQVAKTDIGVSKQPIVSGWIVQLGSFSVEKNAIRLRDQLRKKGYASFVESYKNNGKTSFRVRVGPELTRELAEKQKEKLKSETKLDGLVLAFPAK